jgi:hypothetical protein
MRTQVQYAEGKGLALYRVSYCFEPDLAWYDQSASSRITAECIVLNLGCYNTVSAMHTSTNNCAGVWLSIVRVCAGLQSV